MDGILIVNKPMGLTSFDVVNIIRKVTGCKKAGHTGTLDPEAEGVLPVCLGIATGCVEFLADKDKVYHASMTLGSKTDTQDHTGKIIAESNIKVDKDRILSVVRSFTGDQFQRPPVYSAIKVNGHKLYELARQGREDEIDIAPRRIHIYDISDITTQETDGYINKVEFRVHCSKGTYIRTLCNDMGDRLGCFGHMSALRRLKSGDFSIEESHTVDQIIDLLGKNKLSKFIIPCDRIFQGYKSIALENDNIRRYINGIPIKIYKLNNGTTYNFIPGEFVRIYTAGNIFIGLSQAAADECGVLLKPYKMFIRRDEI